MSGKLSLLLPSLNGGGAERVMIQLGEEFARRGYEVDLVVCRHVGAYRGQVPDSLRVVELGRAARHAVPALARYLGKARPAALLSALENTNIAAAIVRSLPGKRVRTVLSIHNQMSVAAERAEGSRGRLVPRLARLLYPRVDALVAISEGVAQDLASILGIPRERIHKIYNPAVPRDLDARLADPVPHPWLEPGSPPVVLGAGRFVPQKDFPTLIAAFRRLRSRRPCRLVLLGEGPLRSQLERLVADAGLADDVLMPGFVENPFVWMAGASVFALSSAWEGFGNVVAEALACGTPVVSTDCPSGPAEILENGRYGHLVPVGDADALADAIAATLDSPPASKAALRSRGRWFTAANVADRYLELCLGT